MATFRNPPSTPTWPRPRHILRYVPALLQPRFSFPCILITSAILYASYCSLTSQTLLVSKLPPYSGPYDVGTLDIEAPCTQRHIKKASLRVTGEPAFRLDTVLFSLYYPSVKGSKSQLPKHPWIPKPVSLTAEGYARFSHISNFLTNAVFNMALWTLVGSLEIPAAVDVPLYGSSTDLSPDSIRFPVVVFSHGMASSRTDYTHYLSSLASQGYVVAAIEHRDGSCPATIISRRDGSKRTVFNFRPTDLNLDPSMSTATFKSTQLVFRQAEVEETLRVLQTLNTGHGADIYKDNFCNEGNQLPTFRDRLDLSQVTIAGHSFGATLALQTLNPHPSHPQLSPIADKFNGVIALDPGKHSGPLNGDISVPTLIIHSASWSRTHSIFHGRPHFDTVRDIVRGVVDRGSAAWFLTLKGTSHASVTDASLIVFPSALFRWIIGGTLDSRQALKEYINVSCEFLQWTRMISKLKGGTVEATEKGRSGVLGFDAKEMRVLNLGVTHESFDVSRDRERERSVEWDSQRSKDISEQLMEGGKYWQVHVAPHSTSISSFSTNDPVRSATEPTNMG